jgi:uncharacterized protein
MVWVTVETHYVEDRGKLTAARLRHREYLRGLVDEGQVVAGGPWADDSAGFAIYRVEDRAELDRPLAEDPYTTEGAAASRTVHEWRVVVGSVGPA